MKRFQLPLMCLIVVPFLCCYWSRAYSQEKSVSGTVTDSNHEMLPGVTVIVKGTAKGATTDNRGHFSIQNVDPADTLVFSYLGMIPQNIRVGLHTIIHVTMKANSVALSEVVAIGYGTVRKSDLTGSISSVTGKEINKFPTASPLMALEGRSSGVQVMQNNGSPGGPISVRIRGTNSILGNNEPLYVVDGFPISGSNPQILDNSEIKSIEVLKGASAEAIYGSRAANGVVLITTKGGRAGKTTMNFDYSLGFQEITKQLKMMNAKQFATLYNEQAANDGKPPYFTQSVIDSLGQGTNWQDIALRTAPISTYSLNIEGGNDKTQFAINGGVLDQNGIIKNSDFKRYSVSTKIQHKMSDKFSVTLSSVLSRITSNEQNSSGARFGASLISAILLTPPIAPAYNKDGSINPVGDISIDGISTGFGGANPLEYTNETSNYLQSNQALVNSALIFKPLNGLTIKISGGINSNNTRTDFYQTLNYLNSQAASQSQGSATVSVSQNISLLNENIVSYDHSFGKNRLTALAGFTYQNFITESLHGSGSGFLSDVTGSFGLSSAAVPGIPSANYAKEVLLSYLGRINYSYDNKYLITLSLRSDGSSKFSSGDKWGTFPSMALAWKIKDESFLKDVSFISALKLRVGAGTTGSQAISPYTTLNTLVGNQTVFGGSLYPALAPGSRLPGRLKWETTNQVDVGLDLGVLNDRIQMTIDYYNKRTKNLLNSVQLPPSFGYTNTVENVGVVGNQGLELSLTAHILDKRLKWDINGNISFNRNKAIKLYGGQDILGAPTDMLVFSDNISLIREAQPLGIFYGYVENGYDANGNILYKDFNKDGVINQLDKRIIGNPNPKFIYGLNTSLSYGGLELSLFLQGTQGNDIANISSVQQTLMYSYGLNLLEGVYNNHWTPKNTHAKYPRISDNLDIMFSNRFIESGSYLRLRNISLAYNFPFSTKWNVHWINNLQVYVSGQNLLTFTKYSGWDPEVNSEGNSGALAQGIDYYTYPTPKSVTFGVRVEF